MPLLNPSGLANTASTPDVSALFPLGEGLPPVPALAQPQIPVVPQPQIPTPRLPLLSAGNILTQVSSAVDQLSNLSDMVLQDSPLERGRKLRASDKFPLTVATTARGNAGVAPGPALPNSGLTLPLASSQAFPQLEAPSLPPIPIGRGPAMAPGPGLQVEFPDGPDQTCCSFKGGNGYSAIPVNSITTAKISSSTSAVPLGIAAPFQVKTTIDGEILLGSSYPSFIKSIIPEMGNLYVTFQPNATDAGKNVTIAVYLPGGEEALLNPGQPRTQNPLGCVQKLNFTISPLPSTLGRCSPSVGCLCFSL
eukprot:jgi/Botrbrau1/14450/Bobra.0014s0095.1